MGGHSPINGCTTRPEIGPARNTIAVTDLDIPRDIRYGMARVSAQSLYAEKSPNNAPYDISTDHIN